MLDATGEPGPLKALSLRIGLMMLSPPDETEIWKRRHRKTTSGRRQSGAREAPWFTGYINDFRVSYARLLTWDFPILVVETGEIPHESDIGFREDVV